MITTIVKQGMLTLIEEIKYSNGKTVHRILNSKTRIPEEVLVIKEGSK